jgi:hypothetical protein
MFTVRARPVPVLLGVIVVLLGALLLLSVKAFASSPNRPAFTTAPAVTEAHFAIPPDNAATWTLRVWSQGVLLGSASGTSGTLSVPLPTTPTCTLQADLSTTGPGGKLHFNNGRRVHTMCCPSASTGGSGVTTSVSTS